MTTHYRPDNSYQNRYQRNSATTLEKVFSAGPPIVAIVSFLLALAAIIAMLLLDVVVGRYVSGYMSNTRVGWFFSLATTGLVMAIIGTALYGRREGWSTQVVMTLVVVALVPAGIDIYFDGLSVDIIRFGHFIIVENELPVADQMPHTLFRIMVGALSAVGEPLAATSVIIFPVMRELFKGAFGS